MFLEILIIRMWSNPEKSIGCKQLSTLNYFNLSMLRRGSVLSLMCHFQNIAHSIRGIEVYVNTVTVKIELAVPEFTILIRVTILYF